MWFLNERAIGALIRVICAAFLIGALSAAASAAPPHRLGRHGTVFASSAVPRNAAPGSVTFTVAIKPKAPGSGARAPKFISPATTSLTILTDGANPLSFMLTPNSPNCAPNPKVTGQYICKASFRVSNGKHVFTVTAYDDVKRPLSTNCTGPIDIVAGRATTIPLALDGIVQYVGVYVDTQPPAVGKATKVDVGVNVLDADNDLIVGPAPFEHPITLLTSDPVNAPLSKTILRSPADTTGITAAYDGAPETSVTFSASAVGLPPANVTAAILTTCTGLCNYKQLYAFKGFPSADGFGPRVGLIDLNGVLYGATVGGGGSADDGTVFALDAAGRERIVTAFNGFDGAAPDGSLVALNGTLYGTTFEGGPGACFSFRGCGVVFALSTTGVERVLHSFGTGTDALTDGLTPYAPLTVLGGALYGTTESGGTSYQGCGTVFRVDPTSGAETVVYSFTGGADGCTPLGGLTAVNGVLYGTTNGGGLTCPDGPCGTVFAVTPSGAERVVYRFRGPPDGANPVGSLLYLNGELFGTTEWGGLVGPNYPCTANNSNFGVGCGTVFGVTPSGVERVLHAFSGNAGPPNTSGGSAGDGAFPVAGLTSVNGVLYGTTSSGGDPNSPCYDSDFSISVACETIFSVTTTGVEQVKHLFGNLPNDGEIPTATLLNVNGSLYGTAETGSGTSLAGTIFELSR